jgi:UDP-N-acetylmuramoyl-tripeptide--D-alanyl-D-alanine ligase
MHSLHDALPTRIRGAHFETLEAAVTSLPAEIQPQDVVLLKASLSMGMGQVVDALRHLRHSADKD